MVVSGASQLLTAPLAAWLETRTNPRLLTGMGYGLFAAGLLANGFESVTTDFDGLFWPQVLRGASVMLCILPATRLALDTLSPGAVADGSALFNLMRNLGGAIGIALIDTILYGRSAIFAEDFRIRLLAGDVTAAQAIGLGVDAFLNRPPGPPDEAAVAVVRPMVERAALALSVNEAWAMLACVAIAGLLLVPLARDRAD
jgi:DHA2 family multidrug resistance protein